MKNNNLINKLIVSVQEYNAQQITYYNEYCEICNRNGIESEPFSRYFNKFDYKHGYVATGKYPIYRKTKRELITLLGL